MVIRGAIKVATPANRRFQEPPSRCYCFEFILSNRLFRLPKLPFIRSKFFGEKLRRNFDSAPRSRPLLCTLSFSFSRHSGPCALCVHSRPRSRTKSITGYSVTRRCVLRPSVETLARACARTRAAVYADVHGATPRIVIRNLPEHSPSNSRYSRSVSSSYTRHPRHRFGRPTNSRVPRISD